MLTLITATPGSGKTLHAMQRLKKALDDGRTCYTNIDGCVLPGIMPLPANNDWRDTPDGSLVVMDEVQKIWPATGKPGAAPQDDIRALEEHRHTGHDIILITQHPTLVHHHARKLVGEHIHLRRTAGAKTVSVFTKPEVFDPKDSNELKNADQSTWSFPKDLFLFYKSATIHTHKFKMPKKLKFLGIFIILLFSFIIYNISQSGLMPGSSEPDPVVSQAESGKREASARPHSFPSSGPVDRLIAVASAPVLPSVRGCISTPDRCRCWSAAGAVLALDLADCRFLLSELPRGISGPTGNSESRSLDNEKPIL